MKTPDDSIISQQLTQQSTRRTAFEQMVRKYTSQLYWQIRHIVIDHDDTNDVLQNTFIKAWTNIDNFRGDAKLSTWLYRIAVNESLTFLQKKKLTINIDDPEASIANELESDPYFDGDETDRQLQQALQSLPEKQRLVFSMKYFQEMKYEEISEVLNTSVGALKASYHFAVEKIQKFFDEHD
ncbi:MAG: sigma-70 family RNA polymerase sigma factor [Bacteroidaceae bacterium]|nr:sigma-70 family RNA polymerase sigma factor [Bacteroidaceae bacterium]